MNCGFMVNARGERCVHPYGHSGPCHADTRQPLSAPRPVRRDEAAKRIATQPIGRLARATFGQVLAAAPIEPRRAAQRPQPCEEERVELVPVERIQCSGDFGELCPVRTTHPSGICQYHGKRGDFAE